MARPISCGCSMRLRPSVAQEGDRQRHGERQPPALGGTATKSQAQNAFARLAVAILCHIESDHQILGSLRRRVDCHLVAILGHSEGRTQARWAGSWQPSPRRCDPQLSREDDRQLGLDVVESGGLVVAILDHPETAAKLASAARTLSSCRCDSRPSGRATADGARAPPQPVKQVVALGRSRERPPVCRS